MDDNSIDSIVTDPPYELWFMWKSWDSTGIANNKDMWAECLRVLKPGGYLLAFSGTRTYHRMAVAIEDAGFEVRDMIEWVYGSWFPKSLNIGKAVDKLQGNEREEKEITYPDGSKPRKTAKHFSSGEFLEEPRNTKYTKGTSEWEGWGTALKPAHEPICMARKPLAEKTVAENCLKYGTGGINIDESRVETSDKLQVLHNETGEKDLMGNMKGKDAKGRTIEFVESGLGRFPANLIHDNSEEVRECFPETKSGAMNCIAKGNQYNTYGKMYERQVTNQASGGNASRFFKSIIYQAKSSKSDRNSNGAVKNIHPTCKPTKLMEYLIKMVTPKGWIVLDPFTWSWTTLIAAKQNWYQYIGCELTEEYISIIEARLNAVEVVEENKQQTLF